MARWTVFSDNDFWKCSWAHVEVSMTDSCLFLMQCCLRAPKVTGIQYWFQLCPCLFEMSSDFQKPLMTLLTADDRMFKVFRILYGVPLVWNCSVIWRKTFLVNYWTSVHIYFFSVFCLYPVMLLTYCQLTWLVATFSSSCFVFVPLIYPFVASVPTFQDELLIFIMWYVFHILLWKRYLFCKFALFLLYFMQHFNLYAVRFVELIKSIYSSNVLKYRTEVFVHKSFLACYFLLIPLPFWISTI